MWRTTTLEMLPPMLLHWMYNVRTMYNVFSVELHWNLKSVYPVDSRMEYFGQFFCKKFSGG